MSPDSRDSNNSKNLWLDKKGLVFFAKIALSLFVIYFSAGLILDRVVVNSGAKDKANMASANEGLDMDSIIFASTTNKGIEKKIPETVYSPIRSLEEKDINSYIPSEGKIIIADLENMSVSLYKDGEKQDEFKILSKGKNGTRWETPSGQYSISLKEKNHFSSIGKVNMPYSMQFFGNFFIHGWPYYTDGTPVPIGYSGGCIRMSTPDSKVIYEFADVGTSLLVFDPKVPSIASSTDISITQNPEIIKYSNISEIDLPEIKSKAYLVGNIDTGEILLEKNAKDILPIASITKLTTAMVANEAIIYDTPILMTKQIMDTLGESGSLKLGNKYTATTLLYPLLLESSNDAGTAFSSYYGFERFVNLMNKKAEAIGLANTKYADAHGISENNVSTAEDLFRLARYLYKKQQYLMNITRLEEKRIYDVTGSSTILEKNFNIFSAYDNFIGGKTGKTTAAKETMLSMFAIGEGEKRARIAIIVLGSEDRKTDVENLLMWAEMVMR